MPYKSKSTVGGTNYEPTPLKFAVQPEFFALVCRNIIALGGKVTFSVTKQGNLCVTVDHPSVSTLPDKSYINEAEELRPYLEYLQGFGL